MLDLQTHKALKKRNGKTPTGETSYSFDETLEFLLDPGNEDQGNILDDSDTLLNESKNKKPTPLPQDKQKRKLTNCPINSLETAIDENNYENYCPAIPKKSI